MSWTFSHCRSGTISDHYRQEFPDKTLSIDFLSFNILIQNEQLLQISSLKHPLNICMNRLTYLPVVIIFLRWLIYHTLDDGQFSWVDVTEDPDQQWAGGRLGKIVNHILHCVLIFVTESEYYSYNDWADFLGTMELAAAAVTLLHWAMNFTWDYYVPTVCGRM